MDLSEWDPAMICYTSATTGDPKGVVYTHRAIVLHTYAVGVTFGVSEADCTPAHRAHVPRQRLVRAVRRRGGTGCKQVLPGREVINMEKLCQIIADEKVTFTAGVPTIWMLLYDYLEKGGWHDFSTLKTIVSGGAALPRSLMKIFDEKYNFLIQPGLRRHRDHAAGHRGHPQELHEGLGAEKLYDIKTSVGIIAPGLEIKIVDVGRHQVPMDGKAWGEIWLRGPWIASEYYKDPERSKETFAGRMVPHRRRGHHGRGRLHPPGGPQQGPREERGRVDLVRGPREPHHGAPQGDGGRHHRGPAPQVAGAAPGVRTLSRRARP